MPYACTVLMAVCLAAGYYTALRHGALDAFAADVTTVLENFKTAAKRSGLEVGGISPFTFCTSCQQCQKGRRPSGNHSRCWMQLLRYPETPFLPTALHFICVSCHARLIGRLFQLPHILWSLVVAPQACYSVYVEEAVLTTVLGHPETGLNGTCDLHVGVCRLPPGWPTARRLMWRSQHSSDCVPSSRSTVPGRTARGRAANQ